MGIEVLAFVNPMSPPPANPFEAVFFYILLTPVGVALHFLNTVFATFGPTAAIGAFGVAIIAITVIIRGLLFPLFRWQISTQWRIQAEQRKIGPELKEIQQKFKKDRTRLNEETMALYKRHNINPLGQLSGCLPLVIQMPFIYALYGAIQKLSQAHGAHGGFLWVSQLSEVAFKVKGGIAGHPTLLIIPILAGVFTFMQSKMMMQPARPDMSESERQMYRVMSQTTYLMPVLIAFFALNFYQGVGLYWITQSAIMVIQVYTMMGWGGLRMPAWVPGAGWYPVNSPMGRFRAQYPSVGDAPASRGRSGNGAGARGTTKPSSRAGGGRSSNGGSSRPAAGGNGSGSQGPTRPASRAGGGRGATGGGDPGPTEPPAAGRRRTIRKR
ncbi:MAG TPA: YidC/Oxa1 family membrane protein insertase [Candidatus Dormibacteraeota bacterium]|nr:YidC/Oxa1 family membrane protein insertase [Candidatus Dormibacteraeota bacterium]